MPKYKGHEVEVRIATTEAGLGSAPAIPYVSSVEWTPEQNVESTPKGLGSRLQEVKEGLIEYTGSLARDYDETAVSGTDIFAVAVGAYVTGAMTPLYMEIKLLTTGKKDILKKLKGVYTKSVDVDGYVTESYDFSFEEVATA